MTTAPDGLFQHGGAPVGGGGSGIAQFAGMWGNKVYFADWEHGSVGNGGLSPLDAKKHVDDCITVATAGDTIFVRPADFIGTEEDPNLLRPGSSSAIVIPYNKFSMNIIGTTIGAWGGFGCFFRGHASQALSTPILAINAQNCVIENLAFDPRRGSGSSLTDHLSTAQVKIHGAHSNASRGTMTTIYNCNFRRFAYSSVGTTAALVLEDANNTSVIGCTFFRNMHSIAMYGSQDQIQSILIQGCRFIGTASHRDCDISMQGSGNRFIDILDNYFDVDPTAGDIDKFIIEGSAVSSTLVAGNYFNSADAAAAITRTLTEDGMNWDQTGLVGGGWPGTTSA